MHMDCNIRRELRTTWQTDIRHPKGMIGDESREACATTETDRNCLRKLFEIGGVSFSPKT